MYRPQVRRGLCGKKGPQRLAAQIPDLLQGPGRRRPDRCFTEYTGKKVKKAEKTERPSVLAKLAQFKELLKNTVVDRSRRKELER